jgi:2-deoxy-D-gluconate 3-dehydrogenase
VVGTWNNKAITETKAAVENTGRKFLDVRIDMKNLQALPTIVDAAINGFGRIDILVNNAGIVDYMPIEERPYSTYEKIMAVNVNAVYVLTREVCLNMRKMGIKGRIINISSIGGLSGGSPGVAPYVISKHAVFGITQQFACEFCKDGITVNEIFPGIIDTPIHDGTPTHISASVALIPVGRVGEPEDLKAPVVLLASDAAAFITGQRLGVDGGHLLL